MIGRIALVGVAVVSLSMAVSAAHRAAAPNPAHREQTKPAPASVEIKMFAFTPKVLTVAEGTTVTWTNVDQEPHTVTAVGASFHSSALDTNDKFTFTFSKSGKYAYFCRLHPQMTAKVIVRPR